MGNVAVYIETYGCQMNLGDSELMAGILRGQGYDLADRPEEASVILINTCAIRDHAEQRVLGRVGELGGMKRERPDLLLGLTGCMAQRMGDALLDRTNLVDLVVGPDAYRRLPELLEQIRVEGGRVAAVGLDPDELYDGLRPIRRTPHSAWVTISRGCHHFCTYCIVPYVRGREKCRSHPEILEEVRSAVREGAVEVTLLGQNVNSYNDGIVDFAELLRRVDRIDGLVRLRFVSPHPGDLIPEIVEAMAESPSACEHIHLPVQSGSSRVLRRMGRLYTRERYLEKVAMLREAIPEIAITTDIICGFPGETEEQFCETLSLMEEVRFDYSFTFKFSPRPGTPATRLPDPVPEEVKQNRLERLIALQRQLTGAKYLRGVGRSVEVLVERPSRRREGQLQGRTRDNKLVSFEGSDDLIGSLQAVRVTGTTGMTWLGHLDPTGFERTPAGSPGWAYTLSPFSPQPVQSGSGQP